MEILRLVELISRRRRQLHVHAILYYHLDRPLVSDAQYDEWAQELVELQKNHPGPARHAYRNDLFYNWTGDTGMHLTPTTKMLSVAHGLIRSSEEKKALALL